MTEREKRIEALIKEEKSIAATVHEAEKEMTQLTLLLSYLKERNNVIISELISLGKNDIHSILKKVVEDL